MTVNTLLSEKKEYINEINGIENTQHTNDLKRLLTNWQ